MKQLDEVIAEHPFFADMAEEHRTLVSGCGSIAVYKQGEFLFQTGGEAEHFFLLRHGRVSLEMQAPGRDPFRFETVSDGEVIGWSWLFEPYRWQFDARALVDTRVVRFDGTCLRGKLEDDAKLGYDLMRRFSRVLVQRFADTRLQLIDVYSEQPRVGEVRDAGE